MKYIQEFGLLVVIATIILSLRCVDARLGVDMSMQECSGMTQGDWGCLVNNGFTFAIIQAFQGGNGVGPDTARSDFLLLPIQHNSLTQF